MKQLGMICGVRLCYKACEKLLDGVEIDIFGWNDPFPEFELPA